jgi:hypothetical protein
MLALCWSSSTQSLALAAGVLKTTMAKPRKMDICLLSRDVTRLSSVDAA